LLVITDGEDNASRYSFEELLRYAQKSNAVIYTIGLLGSEEPGGLFKIHGGSAHHAGKILEQLAQATGGQAYLPKSLDEVQGTCEQVAHDIRNQYTLAYYPSNTKKDGTFRAVRVDAFARGTHTKLAVRTRPGYFAPKATPSAAVASGQ
jgi:VWFA-related protein